MGFYTPGDQCAVTAAEVKSEPAVSDFTTSRTLRVKTHGSEMFPRALRDSDGFQASAAAFLSGERDSLGSYTSRKHRSLPSR